MAHPESNAKESWLKFLNPTQLRFNLIAASTFITGYEYFTSSTVKRVRDFFTMGFDERGLILDEATYKRDVLDQHKSRLRASLLWLRDRGAIDDADIDSVDRLREHRNELSHELHRFVATTGSEVNIHLLHEIRRVMDKVERWFFAVEVSVNEELQEMEANGVDMSGAILGGLLFLDLLIDTALGTGELSQSLYDEFVRAMQKS